MKNRYLFAGVLMFVVFAFCGCSSAVTVGMSVLPDGTIRQSFSVTLDAKELSAKYDNDEIQAIYSVAYDYLNAYQATVNARALEYIEEYSMQGRYPWKAWIEPSTNEGMTTTSKITCYVLFYSSYFYEEYVRFVGGEDADDEGEEDDTEATIQKGLFYDTIIYQETTLPIADLEQIQSVYNSISAELLARGVELTDGVNLASIYYDYAVPQTYAQVNRLRANCDREYTQIETQVLMDGSSFSYNMKHFVWQYEPDGENRVVLYRYRVNAVAWYVSALVLVVIFGLVLLVAHKIISCRNKRKAQAQHSENAPNKMDASELKQNEPNFKNENTFEKLSAYFESVKHDNHNKDNKE